MQKLRTIFPSTTTNAYSKGFFKGPNAQNSVIIPGSELRRIQNASLIDYYPQRELMIQEKLALKEKSNLRVKNWPNTLEAKRKKKDEARFERFKAEEVLKILILIDFQKEERRKIDKEEAILQALKRKEIVIKANNQIYEDKAKVRVLKGQMLLSDALHERELQKVVNKRKEELEYEREKLYYEQMVEDIEYAAEIEYLNTQEEKEKKLNYAVLQKKQHEEMKQKYIKKMQEDKIEGEIIKKQVQDKLKKEIELEEEKKELHRQALIETHKGNLISMQKKQEDKKLEEKEDQKIAEFAKRKDEILQMRKMREDLKFKDKQLQRQKLIDAQISRLKQLKDNENERINKQVYFEQNENTQYFQIIEAQQKADDIEKKKLAQIAALKDNINKHLALTVAKKAEDTKIEKLESQNYQDYWKQKNIEINRKEQEEKIQLRKRNKELANFHQKQTLEKLQKKEIEYQEEIETAQKNQDFLDDEEYHFNSWAQKAIEEWKNNGKDIKPLLLQMQKFKKISITN